MNYCIVQVQVLQYSPCVEDPLSPSQTPDPFLMLVPSTYVYISDLTFHTSSVNVNGAAVPAKNYITIVSTTEAKDSLTLDGRLISQYSCNLNILAVFLLHVTYFN